jgi:CRP/FNR family transcriptional regulator, cyclic AMP receptor protein
VPPRKAARVGARALPAFDAQSFVDLSRLAKSEAEYRRGETIFRQGDACEVVLYIQTGGVKLSVTSKTGKEIIAGMLVAGDFFGEGCLAGEVRRTRSATAITPTTILSFGKTKMAQLLRTRPAVSDRFIAHLLGRNTRIEEDLVDQLFNSSEKRLARALLVLARYGTGDTPVRVLPTFSQETLAEMIGSTRSRVNFFLNKFKRLGFVAYKGRGPLSINSSLLNVVLHD